MLNNAAHAGSEIQKAQDGVSGPHDWRETQTSSGAAPIPKRRRKSARPAVPLTKPIPHTPGTNPETQDGHVIEEAQVLLAVKRGRARMASKPSSPKPDQSLNDDQQAPETQTSNVVAGDHSTASETHSPPVVATIQELWRRRQSWHRAEKSLTLQARAICRRYVGGDKDEADKLFATVEGHAARDAHMNPAPVTVAILPLMMARETVAQHRAAVEKELSKLAKSLPVYPWVEQTKGFGALSLAALVGECGDIGSYKSVSAVWKRLGLAVINGERQRRVAGPDALLHGYSPQRRSVSWNIGVSLMRAQKAGEPYRDFYDREKEKQLAKELTKGHAHNRACRHMTKRLIANLYGAWGNNEVDHHD